MPTRVFVSGKVQGVWFRESTRKEASALGVAGWVRNLPDGRVEGLFDGPKSAVALLIDWCHRGPDAAEVEAVETEPADESVDEPGFHVLR